MPAHFNIREAAEYLGISPHTLYKLVERRQVPAAKIGGSWRLSKAALDEFVASRSAVASPRVLIVESDPGERRRLLDIAGRRSHMVKAATDYEEAHRLAAELKPDIVFVSVPRGGGGTIDFMRRLRAAEVNSRVALIVDRDDIAAVAEAIGMGPVLVLRRPVEREDLLSVLTLISK